MFRHPSLKRRFAAFGVAACAASTAATADSELAGVVVTATRQAQRANELLADVSVIERDEIERAGVSTVAELLARQPGIELSNTGGAGKSTNVYIRGANQQHTLLLIDGLRVGSATTATPTFEAIPLDQIERIEILRGPASALYGSDAIGGVIQVFTKRGSGKPQATLFGGYGSYGTWQASAGVAGGSEQLSFQLGASRFETEGFNSIADRRKQAANFNPDRDGSWNQSVSGSLTLRPAKDHELGLNLLSADARSWYDGGLTYNNRIDSTVTTIGAYTRNRLAERWTSTVRIGRSTDDSTDFRSTTPSGNAIRTDQDQLGWQNDIRLPLGSLLLGAERLKQQASSQGRFNRQQRRIDTVLAGWTGNLGPHRWQANARHDRNSQFGSRNTGVLAWGYQIDDAWRLNASAGTAFRAPSFNELYFPNFGNPALKPERARNRELGLAWERGVQSASLVYFDNRISNLIAFDSTTNLAANIAKARLTGWTLSYTGEMAGTALRAALDLHTPRDAVSGKRLNRRAAEQATIEASRRFGAWSGGVEVQYVGARYDDLANTRRMHRYTLLNATLKYRLSPETAIEVRGNNLTDAHYETAWGYATAGSNLFVGVRYTPH